MILNKPHWQKADIIEFEDYLMSLSKGEEKRKWEKRIINTSLPCLAVPSFEVKRITKEISKGNFYEYLDIWPYSNWTETSILGGLICKIKDFNMFKTYLDKYADVCDNWATCDLLSFPINKDNKQKFFAISQEYMKNKKPFVRRVGITILFKLVDDENYIQKVFDALNSFEIEEHYYVNMCLAWLFAECFTKQRDKTISFLKTHKMNKFVLNKGIQKCRDSYRVSNEDKEMLLSYKK